jgi:serine/threonine protein kinase
MELCAGGDLLTYVRRRGFLQEDVARVFFKQACAAVNYCHRKNIVHRDVKLDNMLLDIDGETSAGVTLKLCDFGVSRLLQDPEADLMTEQCGTPAYIAPEILLGCQSQQGYRGFSPDVWSLGVCLYAMLYGTVPFKANNMQDLHALIVKGKYALKKKTQEVSRELRSLLRGVLEPEVNKRLTMDGVMSHKWMTMVGGGGKTGEREVEIFS